MAGAYDGTVHLWDVSSAANFVEAIHPRTATPNPALIPTSTSTPNPLPPLPLQSLTPAAPIFGAINAENISKIEKRDEFSLGAANMAAWAGDGKTLGIGIRSGVYIFKPDNPHPIRFLPVDDGSLFRMDFNADGSLLAEQIGGAAEVWDIKKGSRPYKLDDSGCVNGEMTFSADNQTISANCYGLTYRWSFSAGHLISKDKQEIPVANASSDGTIVAQPGRDFATLRDASNGTILQTISIPEMTPALATFSPDGKTLLIWFYKFEIAPSGAYYPGKDPHSLIQVWDVLPGQTPKLRTTFTPGDWHIWEGDWGSGLQILFFSPDSRRVFTASGDGQTQIWQLPSGKLLATLPDAEKVYPSQDGRQLLALGDTIQVWDVSAGKQPTLRLNIPGFDSSPSQPIFTANDDLMTASFGKFHIWLQNKGSFIRPPTDVEAPGAEESLFSASLDGKWLAYSTSEKFVVGENNPKNPDWQTLLKFADPISPIGLRAMQFSPDSTMLASTDFTNKVLLWRLGQPESNAMQMASASFISNLLFSPDGKMLLGYNSSSSEELDLYLWDTATGKLLRSWKTIAYQLAFHPDGVTLATADYLDGTIQLFDLRTWTLLREIKVSSSMSEIAFSTDGSLLVSHYSDKIEFWNAATGQLVRTLKDNFAYMVFSPDGRFLALGLYDGRVQLWGLPEK